MDNKTVTCYKSAYISSIYAIEHKGLTDNNTVTYKMTYQQANVDKDNKIVTYLDNKTVTYR